MKTKKGLIDYIGKNGKKLKWDFKFSEKEFDEFLQKGPARYGSDVKWFLWNGKEYSTDPKFFSNIGIKPVLEKLPIGEFWTYKVPKLRIDKRRKNN